MLIGTIRRFLVHRPFRGAVLALNLLLLAGCRRGRSTLAVDLAIDRGHDLIDSVSITVEQGGGPGGNADFDWESDTDRLGVYLPASVSGPVAVLGEGHDARGRTVVA